MNKNAARLRRAKRVRKHIKRLACPRMSVHRTSKHIYVQVLTADSIVIAQASSMDKSIAGEISYGGNVKTAVLVGQLIAKRCVEKDILKVAFDRSGYQFHGRVKALADAAREGGMEF